MALNLKVDQTDGMPEMPRGFRHKLKTQWFQPQKHVGVKQWPWVNE
jgi:hypothetical protein